MTASGEGRTAPSRRFTLRRVAGWASVAVAVVVVAAAALIATALVVLRAEPGGWSIGVPIGARWGDALDLRGEVRLSVPALVRVATHPIGIRLLDGRRVATRLGALAFRATATGDGLAIRCAPCRIDAPALAARPLSLVSIEATARRAEFGGWTGTLAATGRGGAPVRATWTARLDARDGEVALAAADQPTRDWVALFGASIPEAAQARIEGTAGGTLRLALPSFRPTLVPRLAGLQAEGLGTEALRTPRPALPHCARAPAPSRAERAAPYGGWLPRAVVAAEDQRFFEHPGWDLVEMAAAWSHGGGDGTGAKPRGASTLTQQLARLLVTGDGPTAARKVRELLVAAELERTLGKARILELYLAIAPWGDGQCGAEAAALHLFGRPAARLEAIEAAWLASLLRNPDALLDRAAREPGPDPRLASIARGMRVPTAHGRATLAAAAAAFVAPPTVDARRQHGDSGRPASP